MNTPVLSICVPSRNRQKYFKETIVFLTANPRDDVELVFADNSDDPSVMNGFMAAYAGDPRIRYLPSQERTLSMQENWERSVAATTGDWVSVIGDDDLIDPDLIDALKIATAMAPELDGFGWSNLKYNWVTPDARIYNIKIPLAATFHRMPADLIKRRAFRWDDAGSTLTSGYSIYHAAISRQLLDRVKARFGNRHFEHPTIDYDSALKNAALGSSFIYCTRPFSIFGACPESNSAAVWNPAILPEAHRRFMQELGRDYDKDAWMADFPFTSLLGLPAAVVQVQQWLRVTYNIGMTGWEANFARACARYCSQFSARDDFDGMCESYSAIFSTWKKGAYLREFRPVYSAPPEGAVFTGLIEDALYVTDRIGGAMSPSRFYQAINGILQRPADMNAVLHGPSAAALAA